MAFYTNNRYFKNEPYRDIGFRESSIFLHHKKFGIGISNSNMWWGPGLHSSLTMTNNTTGFPHLMIGTINEKIIGKIGINLRYYFSQLKKIKGNDQIAFQYCDETGNVEQSSNPNGSLANIAGILNENKNVLGMMPHPERAAEKIHGCDDGKIIFKVLIALI